MSVSFVEGFLQWSSWGNKWRLVVFVSVFLQFSAIFFLLRYRQTSVPTFEITENGFSFGLENALFQNHEKTVPIREAPLRVLITGAAGFIGFHLSLKFKERNDYVIGLDNFNDYYSTQLKEDRDKLLKLNNITVIRGDVCDEQLLERLFQEHSFTHVVHLAAQAGVQYSKTNPQAYIRNNVQCFVTLLEVLRNHLDVKLIYASSSSVYGGNKKVPFSEKDRTDSPISLYAATKKECELLAHAYNSLYGISATGLRFFTVYGPWGRPDNAYFTFANAIEYGKPIEVRTPESGVAKRDFTYIDDIVDGVIAATDLGAELDIFNLGTNQVIDLHQYIKVIEEAMGKTAQLQRVKIPAGDVATTHSDVSHAKKELNYNPKISIQEGIPKFIKWYKTYYHLDCRVIVTLEKEMDQSLLKEWLDSIEKTGLYVTVFYTTLNENFITQRQTEHMEFQKIVQSPQQTILSFLRNHSYLRYVLLIENLVKTIEKDPFRSLDGPDFAGLDNLLVGPIIAKQDIKPEQLQCDKEEIAMDALYEPGIIGGTTQRITEFWENWNKLKKFDNGCSSTFLFNYILSGQSVPKITEF